MMSIYYGRLIVHALTFGSACINARCTCDLVMERWTSTQLSYALYEI